MGYLPKTVFLLLTLILLLTLSLWISSSCGASVNSSANGVCILKSVDLELKDLNLSSEVFHGKTCCSASQMQSVSLSAEDLATHGEASEDCLGLFELLEYPNVGIQSESFRICASFCDRLFEACSDAYFSSITFFDNRSNSTKQVIVPCGGNKDIIICGKAYKWESNGTAFCNAMGFTVQEADDSEEEPCYGSNASLERVIESESSREKNEKAELFKIFLQLLIYQMILLVELNVLHGLISLLEARR